MKIDVLPARQLNFEGLGGSGNHNFLKGFVEGVKSDLLEWIFLIFGSESRILDVSSWLYIQFLMRNPIFRTKLSNSGVQRPKNKKNETRKF